MNIRQEYNDKFFARFRSDKNLHGPFDTIEEAQAWIDEEPSIASMFEVVVVKVDISAV